MRLHFWMALLLTAVFILGINKAFGQQSGTRVCTTTTSGSISHEYCSFTPLIVQAPAVTIAPAQVTVQPAPVVIQPAPKPQAAPEKKIKE